MGWAPRWIVVYRSCKENICALKGLSTLSEKKKGNNIMILWREIYYEGRDSRVPISDPPYLWDNYFPIHIKIISWHPSLAGHCSLAVLLISVTQGKGKKEKVKIWTGFQEYWMPSIRFLNTSVALESTFHAEHFIVFGAGIQGQNVIPWRELIRISQTLCLVRTMLWMQLYLPQWVWDPAANQYH